MGVPRAAAQVHGARSGVRLGEFSLLGAAVERKPAKEGGEGVSRSDAVYINVHTGLATATWHQDRV